MNAEGRTPMSRVGGVVRQERAGGADGLVTALYAHSSAPTQREMQELFPKPATLNEARVGRALP